MSFEEIINNCPIRRSKKEKEHFINWLKKYTENSYYKMNVLENDGHKNIIFGDFNKAKILFSAHYDTPKNAIIPNMIYPNNKIMRIIHGFAPFVVLGLFSSFVAFQITNYVQVNFNKNIITEVLFLIIYFGLFYVLFSLKKNKNNYNDNTSGISAIIDLVISCDSDDVCFVLFDDEEKGKKGSKAFAKAYPQIKEKSFLINFDCIGNGNNFVFIKSNKINDEPIYKIIKDSYLEIKNSIFFDTNMAECNSDNKNFDKSIAVLTCLKNKRNILYCDRIHTNKDVFVNTCNIETIVIKSKEIIKKL